MKSLAPLLLTLLFFVLVCVLIGAAIGGAAAEFIEASIQ